MAEFTGCTTGSLVRIDWPGYRLGFFVDGFYPFLENGCLNPEDKDVLDSALDKLYEAGMSSEGESSQDPRTVRSDAYLIDAYRQADPNTIFYSCRRMRVLCLA